MIQNSCVDCTYCIECVAGNGIFCEYVSIKKSIIPACISNEFIKIHDDNKFYPEIDEFRPYANCPAWESKNE